MGSIPRCSSAPTPHPPHTHACTHIHAYARAHTHTLSLSLSLSLSPRGLQVVDLESSPLADTKPRGYLCYRWQKRMMMMMMTTTCTQRFQNKDPLCHCTANNQWVREQEEEEEEETDLQRFRRKSTLKQQRFGKSICDFGALLKGNTPFVHPSISSRWCKFV